MEEKLVNILNEMAEYLTIPQMKVLQETLIKYLCYDDAKKQSIDNFDFLTMREGYDEKELKDAFMDNITKFLLEMGTGFAFIGREYRLMIGEKENYIDLLFYHIRLRCYVVLEVKVTDFDSSYTGKLGTYVVAVNHQLKQAEDNPTIGLLVCKYKDNVEAQYALEATNQPIGVSSYELSKLLPADFKGSLPTIEEIEKELE